MLASSWKACRLLSFGRPRKACTVTRTCGHTHQEMQVDVRKKTRAMMTMMMMINMIRVPHERAEAAAVPQTLVLECCGELAGHP